MNYSQKQRREQWNQIFYSCLTSSSTRTRWYKFGKIGSLVLPVTQSRKWFHGRQDGERRDLMNRNRGPLRSYSHLPPKNFMVVEPMLRPWESGCEPPIDKQEWSSCDPWALSFNPPDMDSHFPHLQMAWATHTSNHRHMEGKMGLWQKEG